MDLAEIEKYKDILIRRIWWIVIPFLLTVLAGLTYALKSPAIYEATTLILVQPQKVPTTFVRDIVTLNIEDRLRTIKQQVTSRTNLEKIIEDYQLYSGPTDRKMLQEERVALLRERIQIRIAERGRGGNAFTITFRDRSPKKAMEVTNALASNFITENLRFREDRAIGTSTFLADELESVRRQLVEREEDLREYRQKYMGAMPEELQANLSILARLQAQLEQLNSNLRDAENRKLIIQSQIAETEIMLKQMAEAGVGSSLVELEAPWPSEAEGPGDVISLRKELALLEDRYTAKHPDIIRLKKMIARLEGEEVESGAEEIEPQPGSIEMEPTLPTTQDFLRPQLEQVHMEIGNLKAEIKKTQSKVELYQQRIEETPKRQQELLSLTRDYDNLKKLYDSLQTRKLEAEISVSMEKKQKGEQFRVLDPARVPVMPAGPETLKIFLASLILGLGVGGGLAYLVEMMDTSYKTPEEVEKDLKLPILFSMPIRYTERELKGIKREKALAFASVAVAFVLSAVSIVLATKGVDKTLSFINDVLSNM